VAWLVPLFEQNLILAFLGFFVLLMFHALESAALGGAGVVRRDGRGAREVLHPGRDDESC
jgi:hypothetical protein